MISSSHFALSIRVKSKENENFTFVDAVKYVAHYFGFLAEDETDGDGFQKKLKDWEIFDRFDAITNIDEEKRIVELKHYDKKILQYLPTPRILPWIEEHISITAMQDANIKYDPVNDAIIIPHYDIDNNLIGIRQRTLIKEREKYGKYMPAVLNNKMYNVYRRLIMKKFMTFIQGILLINNNDNRRVGLSQFKENTVDFSINSNSITNKDVKLSDLLRRS